MNRRDVLRGTVAGFGSAASFTLRAQSEALLTIIGPFGPGGSNDIVARLFGRKIAPLIKRTVIADNKPGAGGLLAAQAVLRGNPPSALLVASNTFLIAAHAYAKPGYDPLRDFTPIAPMYTTSAAWVLRPDHPLKNLKDLVQFAKANPGKLSYATNGVGTYSHLQVEMFGKRNGISMTHAPFRSLPEGSTAVIGGVVDIAVDTPFAIAPRIKSGHLRALAVFGKNREDALPDVPTAEEAGFGESNPLLVFAGLLAPATTSARQLEMLRSAGEKVVRDPEYLGQLKNLGVSPFDTSVDGFSEVLRSQNARYREIIGSLGIALT
ncbi:MAG: tripartite tricarboxylate transporter substrate binding protein [Ottowia sp.]|uniref:Bug family tripartite tricarboxylate transporter substrate binding protein n=1 Tax=Ottowia sp. TaxID=1898956 RepID=UPI003C77F218